MILKYFGYKPMENLIFLHLPKAGGSTFRDIIYRQYKHLNRGDQIVTVNRTKELDAFLNLELEQRQRIRVLLGHFPFGVHKSLVGNYKYFSMLRSPVERVVSAYTYAKSDKSHDYYDELNKNNVTLEEYVKNYNFPWLENGQTKFLAGVEDFSLSCNEETYQRALENVNSSFVRIGLLEYFDESILLFKSDFKWTWPFYKLLNESKKKDPSLQITKEIKELIETNNKFDTLLYKLVKEKLDQQINENFGFSTRLFFFQTMNKLINKVH